jgi:hypothetical protein
MPGPDRPSSKALNADDANLADFTEQRFKTKFKPFPYVSALCREVTMTFINLLHRDSFAIEKAMETAPFAQYRLVTSS